MKAGNFFGLLAILFIGLKLTGYIDWSWWWVLAPLWGPAVFVLSSMLLYGIFLYTRERIRRSLK